MMHSLTSFITLLAFTVHAGWGCCAHHVHAEPARLPGVDHLVASDGHEHGDCRHAGTSHQHQDEHKADDSCPNHQHPRQVCQEPGCTFKAQSQVKLPVSLDAAALDAVVIAMDCAVSMQHPDQVEAHYPRGATSSDRARPLLQTWLL